MWLKLTAPTDQFGMSDNKEDSPGPAAMPTALAVTNSEETRVRSRSGTLSAMYRRFTARAPPSPVSRRPTMIIEKDRKENAMA